MSGGYRAVWVGVLTAEKTVSIWKSLYLKNKYVAAAKCTFVDAIGYLSHICKESYIIGSSAFAEVFPWLLILSLQLILRERWWLYRWISAHGDWQPSHSIYKLSLKLPLREWVGLVLRSYYVVQNSNKLVCTLYFTAQTFKTVCVHICRCMSLVKFEFVIICHSLIQSDFQGTWRSDSWLTRCHY